MNIWVAFWLSQVMLLWTFMCRFLCGHVFVSLGYIPRSGIAGSRGNSMFNLGRNCQTVFQIGCTALHSHQQCMMPPISPFSLTLPMSVFLIIAILAGELRHLFLRFMTLLMGQLNLASWRGSWDQDLKYWSFLNLDHHFIKTFTNECPPLHVYHSLANQRIGTLLRKGNFSSLFTSEILQF